MIYFDQDLNVSECMAERKGFEPSVSYPTQTFQVCTFDHSDTSQHFKGRFLNKVQQSYVNTEFASAAGSCD